MVDQSEPLVVPDDTNEEEIDQEMNAELTEPEGEDEVPNPRETVQELNGRHVRMWHDIPYISGIDDDDDKHRLDVLSSAEDNASSLPVVIHVHGGGWQRGGRKRVFYGAPFMSQAFAQRGFVAVAPSYRLKTRHPDHVEDVSAAVKWVQSNIARYGGDAARVFLCGHSSGAHIVALLATDPRWLTGAGVAPDFIKGVVAVSGLYYLPSSVQPDGSMCGLLRNMICQRVYVRPSFGVEQHGQEDASPVYHLRNRTEAVPPPPFLVLNAARDLGLDVDGRRLTQALLACGSTVEHHTIPRTSHATITRHDTTVDLAEAFIRRWL